MEAPYILHALPSQTVFDFFDFLSQRRKRLYHFILDIIVALFKNPVALKVLVWSRGGLSPSRSSLVLHSPWWRRLTAPQANVSPFP